MNDETLRRLTEIHPEPWRLVNSYADPCIVDANGQLVVGIRRRSGEQMAPLMLEALDTHRRWARVKNAAKLRGEDEFGSGPPALECLAQVLEDYERLIRQRDVTEAAMGRYSRAAAAFLDELWAALKDE